MLGVAVVTVREALTGLRGQGLVTTSRGRGGGTVVAAGAAADEKALARRLGSMSRAELQDRATSTCSSSRAARRSRPSAPTPPRPSHCAPCSPPRPPHRGAERRRLAARGRRALALGRGPHPVLADHPRGRGSRGRLRHDRADPAQRPCRAHSHPRRHERLIDAIESADAEAARRCAQAHLHETLDRVARTQAEVDDRHRMPRSASSTPPPPAAP